MMSGNLIAATEAESFKDDVETFVRCNNNEAEAAVSAARRANESAASEYRDAVDSFNRRARSN
jgi:hypothetical protein